MKSIVSSFDNGTVDLIEDNPNYTFTIKFTDTRGLPPNLDDLKAIVEKLKPAHLAVVYELTFMTWLERDTYNLTWSQWDNLNLTWTNYEAYKQ
jgi:hypothetical protein